MIDMVKKDADERWLTPHEVAALLKFNIKTVRRKLRSQELKGYRFGVRWRIKESDLQAYIKQAENEPPVE